MSAEIRSLFWEEPVRLTRRSLIRTGLLATIAPICDGLGIPLLDGRARAQSHDWRHALSLFSEIKYPPGFKHFQYVNPAAPKGGTVRLNAFGTFDNFNLAVSGVKGAIGIAVRFIYNELMTESLDEVSTEYGLLAEAVRHPADFSSVTYRLRAEPKWHDGKPVTVEDVIFAFEVLKKHHPQYSSYYRHVKKAEQTAEREVTFSFEVSGNRELPQIVGQLFALPKHWWEGTDSAGKKRDIAATTLEPPLGCGAYRIKEFTAGRTIVYERVKDYWGKGLNVNLGRDNFDEIRFEYYRDSTVAIEAFKADHLDWRSENSAKNWATAYDFAAVRDKRVVLEEFPLRNFGVMQAFAFNIRRDKFKDPRVRRAFNFAFDYEEMNKQIFFGQYTRIASYFEGTELACSGVPQGKELEILETVRGQVPAEVFTKPYTNPVAGSMERVRANLREGMQLLKQAGYEIRDHKQTDVKTGEHLSVEFLSQDPSFERILLFYKPSLERLGVTVTVRMVDNVQYENRLRNWDYDMIVTAWPQSLSPGNEQRGFWGSAAADRSGSRNYVGIKNPAVDALIERIVFAKDRSELVAAAQALDRVLLWNYYVVPQWTYGKERTARWDRFGRPDLMPRYGASAFPTVWWWDAQRAAKTGMRQ
jgi:microcin C transport system substrate-binding protein